MKSKLAVVSMCSLGLLAACGPATMQVKPGAIMEIKSIAIIRVPDPVQYTMFNRGSPGLAAGALGAAVVAATSERDAQTVTGAMLRANFRFGQTFTSDLERHLKNAGYRTVVLPLQRDPLKLHADYTTVPTGGADAVLDVVVTAAGYSTENWATSSHWRPEMWLEVALYLPSLKQVVYREKVLYGYGNPFMSATELEAPEKFHYKNKDALLSAGDQRLVEGLKEASASVAAHIAGQLKK